jgi:hypothetical protein
VEFSGITISHQVFVKQKILGFVTPISKHLDISNHNKTIMTQTFKLKKGEISFEIDKVKIADNSRKHNIILLFSSGIWTIYGIISVLRYLKINDQFLLSTGLFIGVFHFVVFILYLLRSNQSEILFADIRSIKVKQRFGKEFLDIKLKNNRLRRVIGVENSRELEEYVESNIENIKTK